MAGTHEHSQSHVACPAIPKAGELTECESERFYHWDDLLRLAVRMEAVSIPVSAEPLPQFET